MGCIVRANTAVLLRTDRRPRAEVVPGRGGLRKAEIAALAGLDLIRRNIARGGEGQRFLCVRVRVTCQQVVVAVVIGRGVVSRAGGAFVHINLRAVAEHVAGRHGDHLCDEDVGQHAVGIIKRAKAHLCECLRQIHMLQNRRAAAKITRKLCRAADGKIEELHLLIARKAIGGKGCHRFRHTHHGAFLCGRIQPELAAVGAEQHAVFPFECRVARCNCHTAQRGQTAAAEGGIAHVLQRSGKRDLFQCGKIRNRLRTKGCDALADNYTVRQHNRLCRVPRCGRTRRILRQCADAADGKRAVKKLPRKRFPRRAADCAIKQRHIGERAVIAVHAGVQRVAGRSFARGDSVCFHGVHLHRRLLFFAAVNAAIFHPAGIVRRGFSGGGIAVRAHGDVLRHTAAVKRSAVAGEHIGIAFRRDGQGDSVFRGCHRCFKPAGRAGKRHRKGRALRLFKSADAHIVALGLKAVKPARVVIIGSAGCACELIVVVAALFGKAFDGHRCQLAENHTVAFARRKRNFPFKRDHALAVGVAGLGIDTGSAIGHSRRGKAGIYGKGVAFQRCAE